MDIETTIRALTGRGFAVQHFATAAEAADYLDGAIDGTTVGIGGSKTIDQLGLYDRLTGHNTVWWHWRTPGFATLDNALTAPVYLSSANAISEDGEILNIDGTGDQPCHELERCVDCRSKSRGCNALLVLWGQMMDMAKVEVVLIDEPLGL